MSRRRRRDWQDHVTLRVQDQQGQPKETDIPRQGGGVGRQDRARL